eukprot:TRINITY_DN24270_c0_g1_i1.p2 TRINITY_DN24270_c0_g1~~TRINITY_DN24270_c0_g1_i1.p2  ORF type:complete len:188 (+),score=22.12 TRINITY_DN24270_c0_g1_i1:178-741(+)
MEASILSANSLEGCLRIPVFESGKTRVANEQSSCQSRSIRQRQQGHFAVSPLCRCDGRRKMRRFASKDEGGQETKYAASVEEVAQAKEELEIERRLSEYLHDPRLIQDLTRILATNGDSSGLQAEEELRSFLSDFPEEYIPMFEEAVKPQVQWFVWALDNPIYFLGVALLVLAGIRHGWWTSNALPL